jgi:hypothetical protein
MKVAFATAVVALLDGCAAAPQQNPAMWAGLKMNSLTLDLEDPKIAEWLMFYGGGVVAATVGERNGYRAGTGFDWRIRGEWLEIDTRGDRRFSHRMRPVKVMKRRIVVEDPSGSRSVYKYSEHR